MTLDMVYDVFFFLVKLNRFNQNYCINGLLLAIKKYIVASTIENVLWTRTIVYFYSLIIEKHYKFCFTSSGSSRISVGNITLVLDIALVLRAREILRTCEMLWQVTRKSILTRFRCFHFPLFRWKKVNCILFRINNN